MNKGNPSKVIHPKMEDGYKNVVSNYTNRSSAIFPLLLGKDNDVQIVFLNYWKIKNKMESVTCNIRIHNKSGDLIQTVAQKLIDKHYAISIKDILKINVPFQGIANIEFISEENFGFPFPAITAFYCSKSNFSGVHSAGRIKNTDEQKVPGRIIETNWRCKWEEGITPFFTIFNGSIKRDKTFAQIYLKSPNNEILVSKKVSLDLENPFSNEFFFLDEILNLDITNIERNTFVEIELPYNDFFPRMICGNYFKKENFLEVTHSFENQKDNPDYLHEKDVTNKDYKVPSINPIATNKDLNLDLVFFPTNCEGNAFGSWRRGSFGETLTIPKENFEWICGGYGAEVKEIRIKKGNKVHALDITKGKIPTRINTNYIYSVGNSNSRYSTDIAAGQITEYFPPKRFTWGHGIIGKGYKTNIFLTSFSHDEVNKIASKGKLTILIGKKEFVSNHNIPAESGIQIKINDILKGNYDVEKINFISWFYIQEKRTKLMSYWVSHTDEGQITGDHAF